MRTFTIIISAILFVAFSAIPSLGETIHVPLDQPTIAAGIEAAVNGDTVLVASGTYEEYNLNFNGKTISVISESGPVSTIINVNGSAGDERLGFIFENGENRSSLLEGFWIHEAYDVTSYNPGAIMCVNGSSPTIRNCTIVNNHCTGIRIAGLSNPLIEGCYISVNSFDGIHIADVYTTFSAGEITGCIVDLNMGYGIRIDAGLDVHITNCTIASNSQDGILIYGDPPKNISTEDPPIYVNNCILYKNGGAGIRRMMYYPPSQIECNDAYGNTDGEFVNVAASIGDENGNFSANPVFCVAPDYQLSSNSPCLPLNNNCGVLIGASGQGCGPNYFCGDLDDNGERDLSDVTFLIAYVFLNGPAPEHLVVADVNCDDRINIQDITYYIAYLFRGGLELCFWCGE